MTSKYNTKDKKKVLKLIREKTHSWLLIIESQWKYSLNILKENIIFYWSTVDFQYCVKYESVSLTSPALADGFFTASTMWEAQLLLYSNAIQLYIYIYIPFYIFLSITLFLIKCNGKEYIKILNIVLCCIQ